MDLGQFDDRDLGVDLGAGQAPQLGRREPGDLVGGEGGEAAGGEEDGAVLIGKGPGDDLGGVVGVAHIKVSLHVHHHFGVGDDHLMEQGQVRPSLHAALDPVEAVERVRRLRGRIPRQRVAKLAAVSGDLSAVATMRAAFDRRRQLMTAMLNEVPGVLCPLPEGAFYCYPSVKGLLSKEVAGRRPASP